MLCALRFLLSWACLCRLLLTAAYNNTGLTDLVEWDKYSLVIKKERVFAFAGEFHYERLPVSHSIWISSMGFSIRVYYESDRT